MLLSFSKSLVEPNFINQRAFITFVRTIFAKRNRSVAEPDHIKRLLHFFQNNLARENKSLVEPDHIKSKRIYSF